MVFSKRKHWFPYIDDWLHTDDLDVVREKQSNETDMKSVGADFNVSYCM